jgi:hypothetical protein
MKRSCGGPEGGVPEANAKRMLELAKCQKHRRKMVVAKGSNKGESEIIIRRE